MKWLSLNYVLHDYCILKTLIDKTGRKLSQWIYLGGVKDFSDGSLGSSSALFYKVSHQCLGLKNVYI